MNHCFSKQHNCESKRRRETLILNSAHLFYFSRHYHFPSLHHYQSQNRLTSLDYFAVVRLIISHSICWQRANDCEFTSSLSEVVIPFSPPQSAFFLRRKLVELQWKDSCLLMYLYFNFRFLKLFMMAYNCFLSDRV